MWFQQCSEWDLTVTWRRALTGPKRILLCTTVLFSVDHILVICIFLWGELSRRWISLYFVLFLCYKNIFLTWWKFSEKLKSESRPVNCVKCGVHGVWCQRVPWLVGALKDVVVCITRDFLSFTYWTWHPFSTAGLAEAWLHHPAATMLLQAPVTVDSCW